MQTKSVLTALSFTMLFSSNAFSMGPRLGGAALRQAARQTGRSGMRQLPGKGAPRRFLSGNSKSWAQFTPEEKVASAICTVVTAPIVILGGVGVVGISGAAADVLTNGRISDAMDKWDTRRDEKQRERELFEKFKKQEGN